MKSNKNLQLGTTLYSLTNEFHGREYTFEQLIAKVAELNLGPGLEIVGFQSIRGFPHVSDAFAEHFREMLERYGLKASCLGINADVALRRDRLMTTEESVAYHATQLHAAAKLGFPVARYQFAASPEVIGLLAPVAERLNVKLGIEIHAPHKVDSAAIVAYREMYEKVRSPNLGFIPDFGSSARTIPPTVISYFREQGFAEDLIQTALEVWHHSSFDEIHERVADFQAVARRISRDEIAINELGIIFALFSPQDPKAWLELMPQVVHIHGKFFDFDSAGSEITIDYENTLPVFVKAGYIGFMSSEWEGHVFSDASGFDKLTAHHALCSRILDGL